MTALSIATTNNPRRRRRTRTVSLKNHVTVISAAIAITWMASSSSLRRSTTDALIVSRTVSTQLPRLSSRPSALCMSPISTESSPSPSSSPSQAEFELQVGRNLDTLRKDYPDLLTTQPDYTIYDKELEVVDPSGVKVHGINSYKNTFRLLHALVKFIYCPSRSSLTFRMCFDKARQNIRIHWNAQVVPREIFGGSKTTLYVDGISVYEMNAAGYITQHRIEQLLMNSQPLRPKEGVFAALRQQHTVTVPSFSKEQSQIVPFAPQFFVSTDDPSSSSSLFAMEASREPNQEDHPGLDWEALERKNKSRKKFGLKPMTPEEFLALEAQVEEMNAEQQQRAAAAQAEKKAAAAAAAAQQQNKKGGGLFSKLLGGASELTKNTCESNFDCERPEVCCDFGFKKMCCSSGSLVGLRQPQLVPVPVVAGYPPEVRKNY